MLLGVLLQIDDALQPRGTFMRRVNEVIGNHSDEQRVHLLGINHVFKKDLELEVRWQMLVNASTPLYKNEHEKRVCKQAAGSK